MASPKLLSFVPGPVHVREEVLAAMARPMMGHRSAEFSALFGETIGRLRRFLGTRQRLYVSTSSSTGLMEAAIRNGVRKRVVNFACGAFSRRWHDIARACGADAELVEVPAGRGISPELVEKHLSSGAFDAITIVHNETSTGVMNPIEDIAAVLRRHPGVVMLVDCVSSLGGVRLDVDALGVDMALAGTQKCFGLPPGLALCTVSERLFEKAKEIPGRGIYFDFEQFEKFALRNQTPATPAIPLVYALHHQLGRMLEEGPEAREARHRRMAARVQGWARERMALFADECYLSPTVTCIANTRVEKHTTESLQKALRGKPWNGYDGFVLPGGYGELKGKTFRIGHMGDIQPEEIDALLASLDELLGF
jgi:aspartate aminotransferase-like enzyme